MSPPWLTSTTSASAASLRHSAIAFDAQPADARTEIYTALYAILTGADTSPRFARLTRDDRKAILEILQTTKSDLPPAWKKAAL